MSDPLSLLPLAIAAGGGTVDGFEAQQLVAAGLTLLQRSAPLVRALAGRRAAILLPTSPQFVVALGACEGRGAVLVNPLAAAPEIAYQFADAEVGAVFTIGALAERVPENVVRVLLDEAPRCASVLAGGTARDVDLGSHFGLPLEGEAGTPGSDDEAAIVYTSAMAGRPLGAILSHANLLANGRSTVVAGRNTSDDEVLAVLPFSHLFGLTVTGTAPLLAGARVTTMTRFHPVRAAELLANGTITEIVGVPAVFHALLAAIERGDKGVGALRLVICGGAPLPLALQDRWFDITGVELRQGYGLTEAGPVCLFNHVDMPNVRGTLGVPFPGVEVDVRDGEIVVRGPNVFRGYLSHGQSGLKVCNGWLHTGDLGRRNPDGTISFAGLRKPMFTRNGFNIYPREIELSVSRLPGVESVQVIAVPSEARENDTRLLVTGRVTESDVRGWCEADLAAYKQPTEIEVSPAA